ncbi:unnamed protein product [Ophioblennius macclurei]
MSGRGRSIKATGPRTQCTDQKTTEKQQNGSKNREETQNETSREQKPKKGESKEPRGTGEQPPVQNGAERNPNHFTEINKQGQPKPGARGKTCAARTTSSQATAPVQPDVPEGPQANSSNNKKRQTKSTGKEKSQQGFVDELQEPPESIVKAKQNGRKAKAAETVSEEKTKMQPEIQKTPTESKKGRTKAEMTTETKPEAPQKATKTHVANGNSKEPAEDATEAKKTPNKTNKSEDTKAANSVLDRTLKTLKIKMKDKSQTSKVVNEIIKNIVAHMKKTQCFKNVEEPLPTGSYYENLKISSPDEFDVMIPLLVERVEIKPFGEDGAYYSVGLKRGTNLLKKFQENETLSASWMLSEFRDEVKKCVKEFPEWKMDRKKPGCPAVTLSTAVQSVTISLDVVLCLMVKSSWPAFTKDGLKIEDWLGSKVKTEYKRKPYYLVPKYEGKSTVEKDGVLAKDTWRISFSHIEKAIIRCHGSAKTCCEKDGVKCCRKDCLKLLKHLLSQLKENDSSFEKFYSYHAKTTLLHACCARPHDSQWSTSDLSLCFQMLLKDFEDHLEHGTLQNFFIPSQNLLSGLTMKARKALADRLDKECREGFPIFEEYLSKRQ